MNEHQAGTLKKNRDSQLKDVQRDILVVDDTPSNLHLLTRMLSKSGYKVRPVLNGQRALAAAQLQPPDLVLLDISMPEMDGYEVCERLKNNQDTQIRDIPIIFISALDETQDKIKAFSVGGVDYVTKPFYASEVLARVETHLALRDLQIGLEKRVAERTAELVQLNAALERFVPREFLSFLHKESITDIQLGDQVQMEMTILFADIWGFTSLSEQMTPQENFNFINAYLGRLGPVVRAHGGFIDKYVGDAIMALFPTGANDAVCAAISMLKALKEYNQTRRRQNRRPIWIGIGLHTGQVMLGTVGEAERMEGTVISDAVNVAERLEGLTKMYGASIVISQQTWDRLPDPLKDASRFLSRIQIEGKQETISIHEILDGDPKAAFKLETKADFERGLRLYYDKEFARANVKFNRVLEQNPEDKTARFYLQQATCFIERGVPPDWEGIETLVKRLSIDKHSPFE